MNANRTLGIRMLAIFLSLVVGAMPALAQAAAAKQGAAVAKAVPAAAKAQPAAKSATGMPSGPQEGIKVHGHWIIEVRNPDGSLAERREFDNRLVDASLLPRILARRTQDLGLLVGVGPAAITLNTACAAMAEPDFPGSPPAFSKTLTVTAPTGPQAGQLILFGSITASGSCAVSNVGTLVFTNASQTSPLETLTEAAIPQGPINVVQGQVFTVSVTLTFS